MKLLSDKKFYRSLPMKRVGVGVIFFNTKKEILLVKPSYKNHWTLPGGVVDAGESPLHAALREVKEELGLTIRGLKFVCVAYDSAQGTKTESLQFKFFGGTLMQSKIKKITLDHREIIECKFFSINQALTVVSDLGRQRIIGAIEGINRKAAVYLETK